MELSNSKREVAAAKGDQAGFSLIELLIVVAIILIIAGIAIPNLVRARISANEASAVNSIRTFTSANTTYASLCPVIGYANTLADLGPGAGGCTGGANITDGVLGVANPSKAGYKFTYLPTVSVGMNYSYDLNAAPITLGISGQRYFYSDASGVIRYGLAGAATNASSALQ